jgi:hypothetical protein|nr:hypothetical protein [Kofleriaceae bacterium]
MPGLINSPAYEASKAALTAEHPILGDALDAIEWALTRETDCDRDFYPLVHVGPQGNIRAFATNATNETTPGVVVVFGFEYNGGAWKVLLMGAFTV